MTPALAGDIAFFICRVHNVVFNTCNVYMNVCMYVMYTFMCILPYRDIYHIIIGLVGDGEIN